MGFIGFSAFAAPAPAQNEEVKASASAAAATATTSFSFYDGSDTEISLALKMLGKRDAQTKTKALGTLKDVIIPSRKPIEIRPAIGHYCYLYGKLMLENDRRVRQLANEVLGALIDRMKKGTVFHTNMLLLLPPWFVLGMHDLHSDTARTATKAFQALVQTTEEQLELLNQHSDALFTHIKTYLDATVDSLSDRALCTADEAEERYERCVTSALLSLGALIQKVPVEGNENCRTLLSCLSKFTTLGSKNPTFSRSGVRHATFQVLTVASTHATALLQEALDPKIVLGVVAEKFPANVGTMWTLVLTYLQHSSDLPWASLQANVLPKVVSLTKHAFYGSTSSMQNLLPFLSKVPFTNLLSSSSTTSFYTDLLTALIKSLESPHVLHGQNHVVAAFTECLSAVLTIFPATADSPEQVDEHAYVAQFEGVVVTAWTKALSSNSVLPERAFISFSRGMVDILPRLLAFQQRKAGTSIAKLAVQLLQTSFESALTQGLAKEQTVFDARMLSTMKYAIEAFNGHPDLLENLIELSRRLVHVVLTLQTPLSGRGLQWLGRLLDLFSWNTLFPDSTAALADYQRIIAPSFSVDKTSFFTVWKHFAPQAPDVLWAQLVQAWDRSDVHAWKQSALPPLSSLDAWLAKEPTAAPVVYQTIWKSYWFDTRVTMLVYDSGPEHSWTTDELAFFETCWGHSHPLVSLATVRKVLSWSQDNKTSPKCWTLLESLLPLLVAINSNDVWSEVLDLVEAILASLAYHSAAMHSWRHAIQPTFQRWPDTYQAMLLENWVDLLHRSYQDSDKCSAAQWAVLAGEYLTVRGKESWSSVPLTKQAASYRQLECMAELCHWNNNYLLKEGYLLALDPSELHQWIFLDVGFALTWYVVDANPTVLSEHVGSWIEPYLMLGDLLDTLGDNALLAETLLYILRQTSNANSDSNWLTAILSSHMDHAAVDKLSPPRQFALWLAEVVTDYLTTELIVENAQKILEEAAPHFLLVLLPRLVQSCNEAKSTQILLTFTKSKLEVLQQSPTDVATLALMSNLLSIVTDDQVSTIWQAVAAIGSTLKDQSKRISVEQWQAFVHFVIAVLESNHLTSEHAPSAFKVASQLLLHAFSAKQDASELVGIKLHSTSVTTSSELQSLHPEFLSSRVKLLKVVQALASHGQDHASAELARHHREAVTNTALRTIADGIRLHSQFHVEFAASNSSVAASWTLIQQAHDVQQALTTGFLTLTHVLSFVDDDNVGAQILQVFNGRDILWDAISVSIQHPTLQAALYRMLRLTGLPVDIANIHDLIDVEKDESETDAAIAELIVTPGLEQALLHVTDSSTQNPLGALLVWDLYLRMFPETNSPLVTSALGAFVNKHNLLAPMLTHCGVYLQTAKVQLTSSDVVENAFPSLDRLQDDLLSHLPLLAGAVFYRTVVKLPTMVRLWWNDDCSRSARSWVAKFCEENVSPLLLQEEIKSIHAAADKDLWDADEMTVRGSKVSREIVTTYLKDECTLEMVIRVPSSYPLRSVEVECTKRIGISEERWRRWVLQILKVTTSQDGSLLDAVLLWKSNVDKEFDGVEPCPICFSILNPKTMGLPNLQCRTCNNKYHNSCLYKWFSQSSKNKCPICQQPFC